MRLKLGLTLILGWMTLIGFSQKMPHEVRLIVEAVSILENNYYDSTFNNKDWLAIKKKAFETKVGSIHESHQAIEQMLKELDDPALRLLTPLEYEIFLNEAGGEKYNGIGLPELFSIDIDANTKNLKVITPVPNSPATKAGIRTNDIIETINGESVKDLFLQDITHKLRVRKDQEVTIGINRNGKRKSYTLTGTEITPLTDPVYKLVTYKKKKIGCIWFPQFPTAAALRFQKILTYFKEQGVEGILLDLRSSPGGLVQEVNRIAGMSMGNKPLAFAGGNSILFNPMMTAETSILGDLPMTILVNQGTASASELLAGGLQHHGRATIVGERTQGKGLLHSFIPLSNGSMMVVSVGRLKLPNGRDILTQGVEPNVIIKNKKPFQFGESGKDKQFKKGLKILIKKLK